MRRDRARADGDVDGGFTLIEIMVSMSLMSVVMVLFTGAVLQMYSGFNKASGLVDASTQINTAFARVDRQVRYASEIRSWVHWSVPVVVLSHSTYQSWVPSALTAPRPGKLISEA